MAFKKGTSGNPEGKASLSKEVATLMQGTREQRRAHLHDLWVEVAATVALRAKSFAKTCSPQDAGKLYQLIMSGAVSIDKAFPPKENTAPALAINLFGNLGQKAIDIVRPTVPTITVQPVKETHEVTHPSPLPTLPDSLPGTQVPTPHAGVQASEGVQDS